MSKLPAAWWTWGTENISLRACGSSRWWVPHDDPQQADSAGRERGSQLPAERTSAGDIHARHPPVRARPTHDWVPLTHEWHSISCTSAQPAYTRELREPSEVRDHSLGSHRGMNLIQPAKIWHKVKTKLASFNRKETNTVYEFDVNWSILRNI